MDLLRTITAERDDLAVQVADLIRERDEMTDLLADTRGRNSQDRQTLIAQVNDVTRQRDELQEEVAAVRKAGRSAMDERDQARESYRATRRNAWTAAEPYLGLATTEQMFRELISRVRTQGMTESAYGLGVERALVLAEMLGGMDASEREYRTVSDD